MPDKRRRFLVNASLQMRLLAFTLLLLAGSLTLVYLTMDIGLEQQARQAERLFVTVDWARRALRRPFILSSSLALLAAAAMTLLWSHRIAGPIQVLCEGLRRLREGDASFPVSMRGTDALSDLVSEFAKTQSAVRERGERLARAGRSLERAAEKLRADHKPQLATQIESAARELLGPDGEDAGG